MRLVFAFLLFFGLLSACSLPRIIVLNDPLNARQHNDLGVSYEHRGEFDLAIREYERAAILDRDWALPLINLGNVRAAQGEWEKAAAGYHRALRREPGNAAALNNLAWVTLQGGDTAAALEAARQAVDREPDEPAYLDTLAGIQLAMARHREARITLDRALSLAPAADLRESLLRKSRHLHQLGF